LNQTISNTGGWQNWATFTNKLNLSEGIHTFRLQAISDGFNINWIQIGNVALSVNELKNKDTYFNVFPNPGKGIFTIKSSDTFEKILLFDKAGKQIGIFDYAESIDFSSIQKGMYLLNAINAENKIVASRFILIE
jgi:hypothetical protein